MKKLIMAAIAVMAVATVAQASTYNWKMTSYQAYYDGYKGNGSSSAKLTSGTAYLFVAAASDLSSGYTAYSQADLVKDFQDGTALATIQAKAIANTTIGSTGVTAAKEFTYNGVDPETSGSLYAYAAIFVKDGDKEYVYISNVANTKAMASSTGNITVGASANASSKLAPVTTAYSASGWYAAAPEPTSGLLLLLGMAGLALRRRRA